MKNRILLIDPYFKEGLKGFSIGLAYIAGALKKEGYDVLILDLTAHSIIKKKDYREILKKELSRYKPDIIGITSTSPTHQSALEIAKIIKKIKDIPIIKGGPHETNCAETTIKNNPEINYSVVGEGERTIVELVDAILNNKSIKNIKGIVYRENGTLRNNGRRELIQNLDDLPMPARELFYINKQFNKYYSADLFNGKKSTTITTSRGCPYNCSFCSARAIWGGFRQRSVDNVIKELEKLYSYGFRGFMIEDDMSLANKTWFLDFAKEIKQKRLKIEYSLQTRADAIDEEIAKSLEESGCKFMYFGVESGVQDILDKCNKKITIKHIKEAFDIAKKYKIRCMASIQFGLPGEDLKNLSTVKETIRVLNEELKPDEVAISYTALYPGSPLAIQEGITPEMYENYMSTQADKEIYKKTAHGSHSIHLKDLTPEKIHEIEQLLKKELKIKRFKVKTFYKV